MKSTPTLDRISSQPNVTRKLLGLAVAGALGIGANAFAQDTRDEAENAMLEEVIVTATRREESLMDVPLSVTAFSGEELELVAANDITYVAQTTPNVTLEVSRGTNSTLSAFIRGVGQQDPVVGFESGVGLYIDDVYLARPQAGVLDIYDVERIEVLRGPQGTLYGRNTIGGAIKYVTRRLSDEPEFKARMEVGSYSQLDVVLTGSIPLGDTFRIGGSVANLTRDGFGDNLYNGRENYNKDLFGYRFSAEWEPTDSLFIRLSTDSIEDDSDPKQGYRVYPGAFSGLPVLDDIYDTRANLDNPRQSVEADGVTLLVEWDLGSAWQLRSITADREDTTWTPIDFDSLPVVDMDAPALYDNEQFSSELQFLYSGDRLNGAIGAFYMDAEAFNAFDVILGQTGDLIGLPGLAGYTEGQVKTDTWSIFADFTWQLADHWDLSLGGRYTEDKRTSRVLRQNKIGGTSPLFGGSSIPISTSSDFQGSATFDKFTPRVSLSWKPNADHNVYGTYSEGFKGGSFDPRGQTSLTPDFDGDGMVSDDEIYNFMLFQPEEVESIEFGWKATLLGGRMTSAVAVFFTDYTNVQIPGSLTYDSDGDGIEDAFAGITTNAAKATINGAEWEGQAILADGLGASDSQLRFSWSLGYLDGEFDEYIDPFGQDVADERVIQNTPEWTGSGTLSYDLPVDWFARSGNLGFYLTAAYRGEHSQFEEPTADLDQDAYTLWNLSIVWTDDSGHWQAGLHGKNLTDEEYIVAGYYFPTFGLENNTTVFYGNPRQISATLQYRFF